MVGGKRPPFGDCMFGRHEKCKVKLENGEVCNCECGDKHGSEYVPLNLDTPLHRLFMKIAEAHKAGKSYSESDEFKDLVVELGKEKEETAAVVTATVKIPEEDLEETIEELEQKRLA